MRIWFSRHQAESMHGIAYSPYGKYRKTSRGCFSDIAVPCSFLTKRWLCPLGYPNVFLFPMSNGGRDTCSARILAGSVYPGMQLHLYPQRQGMVKLHTISMVHSHVGSHWLHSSDHGQRRKDLRGCSALRNSYIRLWAH